jgi:hypothetical protein
MRSGERCCCSRCRDDPETSGPCRDQGESCGNGEHGGAAQERKQGRCDDGPASGGNPQCRRQVPEGRQVLDRGEGRKVFIGIAGRKTPDPKPGRKVRWKGGPKGQVPDTGSRDLWLRKGPRREAGVGYRVARPSPKGGAARWVSGAAGGQDTQVVWKVGASRTAGMVRGSARGVVQGRSSDDAGRRARKRPPFLLLDVLFIAQCYAKLGIGSQ